MVAGAEAENVSIGVGAGSNGTLNVDGGAATLETVSFITVGNTGTGTMNVLNGGIVTTNFTSVIGFNGGSVGFVTVNGAGSAWSALTLDIGNGGAGTLNILNGGVVTTTSDAQLSLTLAGTGLATVDGAGSVWNITDDLFAGFNGTAAVNITNGGVVNNDAASLAFNQGAAGSVTVDGAGSQWTNTGDLTVGVAGSGTMGITAGGVVTSAAGLIANDATSSSTVEVNGNGSLWTTNGALRVGVSGTGSLFISAGGDVFTVGASGSIGTNAGSRGLVQVDGLGSLWDITFDLAVGDDGNGTLQIFSTGLVDLNGVLNIASDTGSTGLVIVGGGGSLLQVGNSIVVGNSGTAVMQIESGGDATSSNGLLGNNADSSGRVLVTGAGSLWDITNALTVGDDGVGQLDIKSGGEVDAGTVGSIGDEVSGVGSVTVQGAGSLLDVTGNLLAGNLGSGQMNILAGGLVQTGGQGVIGSGVSGTGSVLAAGAGSSWNIIDDLTVADAGIGSLSITTGAVVQTLDEVFVGQSATGTGRVFVNGTGSLLAATSDLFVGDDGTGELEITAGGRVTNFVGVVGRSVSSSGTATIRGSGSEWSNLDSLGIGIDGSGALNIEAGGLVTSAESAVGFLADGRGDVLVDGAGSLWAAGNTLTLGDFGEGSLFITGGGRVTNVDGFLGDEITGFGTAFVQGAGSTWTNSGALTIGGAGQALVSVINGGVLSATGITLAQLAGSEGVLFVGPNGAAGIIDTPIITGGLGSAFVVFDHTSPAYQFDPLLAGNLRVGHTDVGTTIFPHANTYTGGTFIAAGRLITQDVAALGTGLVQLDGGALAPSGTLGVDSLIWTSGNVALAPAAGDNLVVANAFTNGGDGGEFELNPAGITQTTYTLVTFGTTNFDVSDFSAFFSLPNVSFDVEFILNADTVQITILGATATGAILQNSAPVLIPTFADFFVNGVVTTGTPTESNTIKSLTFANASSLEVFNTLTVTSGRFNVPSGSALINGGTVVTPGDFLKLGAGNLVAGSTFQVNGEAVIQEGGLFVNGTFNATQGVTVDEGGLLGGFGVINGDVLNDGIVAPGTSPGTLTINGNFTQSTSGTLEIEPGDLLSVSGNAALGGALDFAADGLRYGQQFGFLEAGSISGEFDEILVTNPSRNRGRFLVEGGTGILLIAPTSYTLVAKTDNQRNVAKALDSFIPQQGNDQETVSIALDLQSEGQYPAAFDQIAPTFYESLADITIEQANAQNQNLAQRASALRLGARGFQSIGIEAPLKNDRDGKSVMDAKDGKDILSPAEDNKWGVWVQGNGNFARATTASQVPNYNFESGGFLAGADYRWSENFVTGLYAGYQGTYAKYDNGGRTTINSVQFGGYASYDNGGFYTDAIVGGGYSAYAVKRPIAFSTVDRTATSRPDGGQLTTYLGMGYDWEVGNFTIGPILSGQYTYAGITPFEENGAGALNLNVGQQNANSLRTSLGGRIAYTWKLTDSITLIPEGRMFWQHEFLENPRNIGATLDGGNGQSFGYTTSTPDRDAIFAGAGIIGQFGPNWNAYFYYNADFGRQDFVSHAISTGLNFKF